MEKSSKVLLFDLGNVLLPIDLDLTYKAFASYSSKFSFEEIKHITSELGLWVSYEAGHQSDQEFRNFLKKELALNCSDEQFDKAFNALLLHFDYETYLTLNHYKEKFSGLYLLSNTSKIHSDDYFQYRIGESQVSIFDLFDHLFLSYEMGVVKPDSAIYHMVSEKIGVPFQEIIFFDDNFNNIETALNLGMDAHLIIPENSINQIKITLNGYFNK